MIVTTCLEFADRFEGQVLHEGDEDSCRNVAGLIDALSYSGGEQILSSSLRTIPQPEPPLKVGQCWFMTKPQEPPNAPQT